MWRGNVTVFWLISWQKRILKVVTVADISTVFFRDTQYVDERMPT